MAVKLLRRFGLAAACLATFACSDGSAPGDVQQATDATQPPAAAQSPAPEEALPSPATTTTAVPAETPDVVVPPAGAPDATAGAAPQDAGGEAPTAVRSPDPTQHTIKGVVTQWAPLVLFVNPGDQILFRQMAGHDAETIEGMIPEGAATWQSKLGEEGFAVTLTVPGAYVYKCNPHVSLGMIGAIIVGDTPPHNLEQIEAHPDNKGMIGRAIRKMKQALETRANGG